MMKKTLAILLAALMLLCAMSVPGSAQARFADAPANQTVYAALKREIEQVAAAGGSTRFTLTQADCPTVSVHFPPDTSDDAVHDRIEQAVLAQVQVSRINQALLADCPYALYWHDKTHYAPAADTYALAWSFAYSQTDTRATLTSLSFTFRVAEAYRADGDPYTVTADLHAVRDALARAERLVEACADLSDVGKLYAYKTYLCAAIDYPRDVTAKTPYGDPWQMIWAFDDDPTTNVVCEGYAKAFAYLCAITRFSGDVTCHTVTGRTNEPHMWNIVSMNGCNYLVDVTNSDSGGRGRRGELFLCADVEGDVASGYRVGSVHYQYDDATRLLYQDSAKFLLPGPHTDTAPPTHTAFHISAEAGTTLTLAIDGRERARVIALADEVIFPAIPAAPGDAYTLTYARPGYAPYTTAPQTLDAPALNLASPPLRRLGDIDGNGRLDRADLQAILAHLRGRTALAGYAKACADCDQNGAVDLRDAMWLLRHCA